MKITLDTQELNQAVLDYLNSQGLIVDTTTALVEITSEGVKIDTNPAPTQNEATQKTKTEKKTEPKPTAKSVPQKETNPEPKDTKDAVVESNAVDEPTIIDSEDNAEHEVSGSLFTNNKAETTSNAFAFKQSITQDVRKLFA